MISCNIEGLHVLLVQIYRQHSDLVGKRFYDAHATLLKNFLLL